MLARVIYGFRISVLFGSILTVSSALIGVTAGAVQGFFGGWTDLSLQRFIEILGSLPHALHPADIIGDSGARASGSCSASCCLFEWTAFVGPVRAEFLRGRNFEYVRAARALGLSNAQIMFKHILPNAMVATVTFRALHPRWCHRGADRARLSGLRPAARLAVAGRTAAARQAEPAGAMARPHRLLRDRPHAEPAGVRWARPSATRSIRARRCAIRPSRS